MGHIEGSGGGWKYFLKKFSNEDRRNGVRTPLLSQSQEDYPGYLNQRARLNSFGDSFASSNYEGELQQYNISVERDTRTIYLDEESPFPTPTSSQMVTPLLRTCSMSNLMQISKKEYIRIKKDRAVTKSGVCNFIPQNIESRKVKYLSDIFTTLLDLSWCSILAVFCFCYVVSWLFFATFWYLVPYLNGDMEQENIDNPDHKFCITGIQNFVNAFLFSIETQHTTGYGYYHITAECASAIFILCFQSIFGVIIEGTLLLIFANRDGPTYKILVFIFQGVLVGLVFVKMGRAKKRNATLLFSRKAVISQRDGQLYLMFRIADMRRSSLLGARVKAQIVMKKVTMEGEVIPYHQEELSVGGFGEKGGEIFLFWPTTGSQNSLEDKFKHIILNIFKTPVVHPINKDSPLYKFSAADFGHHSNFELIVCLEGIVESTGLTTQAKTSYLPSEILWGYRFKCLTSMKTTQGERIIDFTRFNGTELVKTPTQSQADIDHLTRVLEKVNEKEKDKAKISHT